MGGGVWGVGGGGWRGGGVGGGGVGGGGRGGGVGGEGGGGGGGVGVVKVREESRGVRVTKGRVGKGERKKKMNLNKVFIPVVA